MKITEQTIQQTIFLIKQLAKGKYFPLNETERLVMGDDGRIGFLRHYTITNENGTHEEDRAIDDFTFSDLCKIVQELDIIIIPSD
jgi:hypothetical protein